jgi:hypothetical protein
MSKKSSKTKMRKSTKRTTAQADSAPEAVRKLIPELAALKLSPKIASKLEALTESEQDRVLSYVNTGMKITAAYQRTIAGKSEQAQPDADAATPTPEPVASQADATVQALEGDVAPAAPTAEGNATPAAGPEPASEPGQPEAKKTGRAPKAKKEAGPKKLSAIDAAAKVLAEAGQALNCQEMIDAMATNGYWTSPGGKTPAATLYSAILRELQAKGNDARFKKTERGKFAIGKAS